MTTTKWPITQLIEEEIEFIEREKARIAKEFSGLSMPDIWKWEVLEKILPKIVELENEQNKWISVEERFPTISWKYLVELDNWLDDNIQIFIWTDKESWLWWNVSRWMPLPTPPINSK